jgi:hypothetical protein
LKPKSIRFLLSDFLFPGDPGPLLRRFAAGAARVVVIQVLDPWELEPEALGPVTLVDCEGGHRLDLDLAERAVGRYRERLERLCGLVERTVSGLGGLYVCLRADSPAAMFREGLLPAGVVEPA